MKELFIRLYGGAIYVGLVVGSIFLGDFALAILLGIFSYLGTSELGRLTGNAARPRQSEMLGVGIMFLFAGLALIWFRISLADPRLLFLAAFITFMAFIFISGKNNRNTALFHLYLSITYLALPLFLLLALMNPWRGPESDGQIVLGLFVMIWVFDSFAYLSGKLLGRHKLAPSISPKKTWEGFAGGLIFTMGAAWLWASWYSGLTTPQWIAVGLIAGIAGTAGDLFESMLKRRAGVKDSGNLIPGHGGILDRIDSILFAAPVTFLFIILFFRN